MYVDKLQTQNITNYQTYSTGKHECYIFEIANIVHIECTASHKSFAINFAVATHTYTREIR